MKNLKQISIIHDALSKERESLMTDVSSINHKIRQKQDSLKKIIFYQNEYANGVNLNLSRSVPVLSKNLNSFTRRMNEIIRAEELEIAKLAQTKEEKLRQLETLDNKLMVMNQFSENIRLEQVTRSEKAEQFNLDEMSVNQRSRGGYE